VPQCPIAGDANACTGQTDRQTDVQTDGQCA